MWLYFCFPLSLRLVEDMLAARGAIFLTGPKSLLETGKGRPKLNVIISFDWDRSAFPHATGEQVCSSHLLPTTRTLALSNMNGGSD